MRKQQRQIGIYGKKHIKNGYSSQEETVQCKQPHELSVICF